jgi:hypothetical protein
VAVAAPLVPTTSPTVLAVTIPTVVTPVHQDIIFRTILYASHARRQFPTAMVALATVLVIAVSSVFTLPMPLVANLALLLDALTVQDQLPAYLATWVIT